MKTLASLTIRFTTTLKFTYLGLLNTYLEYPPRQLYLAVISDQEQTRCDPAEP